MATDVNDEFGGSKASNINLDGLEEDQNDVDLQEEQNDVDLEEEQNYVDLEEEQNKVDLEEEQNDVDLDNIEWLTELKREFSEITGRKCRYTQIQFYLKLPTLKKMDLTHLKRHYERYKCLESMHDPLDNTAAVISGEKKAKKCIPMKRKFLYKDNEHLRKSKRIKKGSQEKNEIEQGVNDYEDDVDGDSSFRDVCPAAIEVDKSGGDGRHSCSGADSCSVSASSSHSNQIVPSFSLGESLGNTSYGMSENCRENEKIPFSPNTDSLDIRNKMMKSFGIVSPFLKEDVPSEEEKRRFSSAVHLFSKDVKGNVNYLKDHMLTPRDFRDILVFAGPKSKWKMIPDRSLEELEKHWLEYFVTPDLLHNPSNSCPFEHCKLLEEGNMNMASEVRLGTKSKRKLFSVGIPQIDLRINDDKLSRTSENLSAGSACVSPTKEQLLNENERLKKELGRLKMKQKTVKGRVERNGDSEVKAEMKVISFATPKLVKCTKEGCTMSFVGQFGLTQHLVKFHKEEKKEQEKKVKISCPYCGKLTIYVNMHIRAKHPEKINNTCPVCKDVFVGTLRNHRKDCRSCPHCDFESPILHRLLGHIKSKHEDLIQDVPLDLRSPNKRGSNLETKQTDVVQDVPFDPSFPNRRGSNLEDPTEKLCKDAPLVVEDNLVGSLSSNQDIQGQILKNGLSDPDWNVPVQMAKETDFTSMNSTIGQMPEPGPIVETTDVPRLSYTDRSTFNNNDIDLIQFRTDDGDMSSQSNEVLDLSLKKTSKEGASTQKIVKRDSYPFQVDEPYFSELESDDDEAFTTTRRNGKDFIMKELLSIDQLKSTADESEEKFLDDFEQFMRNRRGNDLKEYNYMKEPSTNKAYRHEFKNIVLPAFRALYKPFKVSWLLDCKTPKNCTFEGEERVSFDPKEPIYFNPRVVEKALEIGKERGRKEGGSRGTTLNTIRAVMRYLEINLNKRSGAISTVPGEKILLHHQCVLSYISGTGAYKMVNDEKSKAQMENQKRENYLNPTKQRDILRRYKEYKNCSERLTALKEILSHCDDKEIKLTDKEFSRITQNLLTEVNNATGCRPVALTKLTVSHWIDKSPGFNPYKVSKDDRVIDEQKGEDKIWRRLDPNVPKREDACEHQLESQEAFCPFMCENRADPDGWNILIDHDKTSGKKGPSYLHIPEPLKHIMDIYYIKRVRFFQNRKFNDERSSDWIHGDDTPFFMNSNGNPIKHIDLSQMSEVLGVDVSAYDFRKMISTWAMSHESLEIQQAETEALQHEIHVAKDKYSLNKQLKPQLLVQTYTIQEELFPEAFIDEVDKSKTKMADVLKDANDARVKARIGTLLKKKENYENIKRNNRPLGPHQRILGSLRNEFLKIIEEDSGVSIENILKEYSPSQWRHFIVRKVCSMGEDMGLRAREIWLEMYRGDLVWGVR